MNALANACKRTEKELNDIKVKIIEYYSVLESFEKHAAIWPEEQVALRLVHLSDVIVKEATRLMAEHGGRGYVTLAIGQNGICHITWLESLELLDGKECCDIGSTTYVVANIMLIVIMELVEKLKKGDWTAVVDWLNNHAIYSEEWKRLL